MCLFVLRVQGWCAIFGVIQVIIKFRWNYIHAIFFCLCTSLSVVYIFYGTYYYYGVTYIFIMKKKNIHKKLL